MVHIATSLVSIPLLFTSLVAGITFDCSHIREDGVKFDFSKLEGPHTVISLDEDRPPAVYNTTWTVDICKPLERLKDVDKAEQCQQGTYICGIERFHNPIEDPDNKKSQISKVVSVAGEFSTTDGTGLEPKYTRLKSKDSKLEGLEVELHGGSYNKRKQKAVIEFQCDKDRTGNEGTTEDDSKLRRRASDDDDDKKNGKIDDKKSLTFVSYGSVEGNDAVDVLRLNWKTKYACEDYTADEGDKKGGWGFFTWLILILFVGTAAYLIFGSWLNYNRYGARGWDLLPHGDTIRDIPYLFKDWSRKVVDTVSGGGSRGGYSAV